MTAAHKEWPFGTMVKVTNEKNGKAIKVRINDRGPFVRGRIIDLSRGAASKLDMVADGIVPVKLEVVRWGA
jgi:rare lipoprotein A